MLQAKLQADSVTVTRLRHSVTDALGRPPDMSKRDSIDSGERTLAQASDLATTDSGSGSDEREGVEFSRGMSPWPGHPVAAVVAWITWVCVAC